MAYVVCATWKARPGTEKRIEQILADMVKHTPQEPGCPSRIAPSKTPLSFCCTSSTWTRPPLMPTWPATTSSGWYSARQSLSSRAGDAKSTRRSNSNGPEGPGFERPA